MACVTRARSSKHLGNQEPTISILNLPYEIQCEIFTHSHRENEPSRLPMEVVLSHVCSKWRSIVINLPSLWTSFRFDTRLRVSDPLNKLEEYLCRSGTSLLELYFNFSTFDYKYEDNFDRDQALVETAVAHACRWCRFTLFAKAFIPSFALINLFDELYVPNLEYLALCLLDNSLPGNTDPFVFTGGAPKLYAVRIDPTIPLHLPPPFSNITTLAIKGADDGCAHFPFRNFFSVFTIPTLTNLSIEACSCLDPWTRIYDRKKFQMPSLKILRISQHPNILDSLSWIDAPLLETLVLYNVDLMKVFVGQDVVTAFIRLDTIAIVDCSYQCRRLDEGGVNKVDMALNTLACHATHIIISSYSDLSFVEKGSNVLDSSRYGWPRLQRITLHLSTSRLAFYIDIFKRSPHLLTVRVVESLLDQWARLPDGLTRLEKVCKLESMKVGDPMMDEPWPAPGGLFEEDGTLKKRFIWEKLFVQKDQ